MQVFVFHITSTQHIPPTKNARMRWKPTFYVLFLVSLFFFVRCSMCMAFIPFCTVMPSKSEVWIDRFDALKLWLKLLPAVFASSSSSREGRRFWRKPTDNNSFMWLLLRFVTAIHFTFTQVKIVMIFFKHWSIFVRTLESELIELKQWTNWPKISEKSLKNSNEKQEI